MSDATEMPIEPGLLNRLVVKMRAVSLGDEDTPRDARDNAGDQGHHITLVEEVGGAGLYEELVEEIDRMVPEHQHALVALMWVGRGDFDADDWDEALALAADRADTPTARYILSHPLCADEIAEGLDALGHDDILRDGAY